MRRPLFLLFVSRWELIFLTQVEDVKSSPRCSPAPPQTFPQAYTLAALSTPQALLSQLLPFMRSVVAEFWLNIC